MYKCDSISYLISFGQKIKARMGQIENNRFIESYLENKIGSIERVSDFNSLFRKYCRFMGKISQIGTKYCSSGLRSNIAS